MLNEQEQQIYNKELVNYALNNKFLSVRQRDIIIKIHIQGKTHIEVAKELNISRDRVRQIRIKAEDKIKKVFKLHNIGE